jgi:WD40 repeat protein
LAASHPSDEFLRSQLQTIAYSGTGRKEVLTGIVKKESLDPPLRTDLSHLKFSPDSQYVLAQDDSSIFVLSREPFALQFRIDAPDAHAAQFTPDPQGVVFDTRGMRVEEWYIADEQRTGVHELVVPDGCAQTLLAPDGKTLACFNSNFDISLLDVASSSFLFQKKGFFQPSGPMEGYFRLRILTLEEVFNVHWVHMAYSPDMRYFIAATNTNRIAVDLTTHSAVPLHGAVGDMVGGGFAFVSADRIVAQDRLDNKSSAIVTFPSGAVLRRFQGSGQDLKPTAHGNYVILNHVKDARAGIMELNTQKIYTGPTKLAALDAYDQHFLAEKSSGEIGIWDLSTGKLEAKASLPRSPLAALRTWAVSPDLKWLAFSANTRGAVWDLSTAQRLYYTRGFHGSYFDNDQVLYADFPKLDTAPRAVALLDLGGRGFAEGTSISENSATSQYGQYLVVRKPVGKQDTFSRNVALDVQNVRDGHSLWSRSFPKEVPRITVNSDANRMVLGWKISEGAAKDEIKSDPSLESRFAAMQGHEGAYLLEILELETGKNLGKLLVDTGKGSFRLRGASAAGDWVLTPDNENRTLVYSLSTGEKKATLFGAVSTISTSAGLLAIENESGQLDIYGLPDFEKRAQLNFSSNISLADFGRTGDRLLVLTSDQTVYIFNQASGLAVV